MEWRDTGVLLSVRKHGETAAIIEVFTESHGRHAGVVHGGVSRRLAPMLQPGAQISVAWRARLEDHIGTFSVEPIRSRAVQLMQDRLVLAAFSTISALLSQCLPEREDHRALYENTVQLIDNLGTHPDWLADYALWEADLLRELGYGLDLNECAVTGATQDLVYVSPKSGRAVSRAGAGEWADKLLPLPLVLRIGGSASRQDICQALNTTGYFLERRVMVGLGRAAMPAARDRFITMLSRGLE